MLQFGIIGMGIRGKMFAETIGESPYAQVRAVCDVRPETARAAAEAFKCTEYTDFRRMMDEEKLDAVIVATPDFAHREPVLYAAEKGLDMLVEKPFATSEEDAEAMAAAIEKAGVRCMVAFENRWNLPIVAAKEQIATGALGDILNVNARLSNTLEVPTNMLGWSRDSSVGWFLFPHLLDMILWFNGGKQIKKVYAVGTKKKLLSLGYDVYDTLQATVSFSDGTNATMASTWVLPRSLPLVYDLKMEIIGEENALYIDTQDQCVRYAGPAKVENIHSLSQPIDGFLTGCSSYMLRHFIDCLRRDEKPLVDERLGVYNTKVICAIHESARRGGEIIGL